MNYRLLSFVLGSFMCLPGLVLLIPLAAAGGAGMVTFGLPALASWLVGAVLLWQGQGHKHMMTARDGAVLILLVWLSQSVLGSLPYGLSGSLPWSDALLESIAGVTTTGTTGLSIQFEGPLLLWHSLQQWLGGLTTLSLMVSVVPAVSGSFGLSLSRRSFLELSRSFRGMRRTISGVVAAYTLLTVLASALYVLCGLSWPEACQWALVTASTGGSYPGNVAAYGRPLQLAMMAVMVLASGNFLMYGRSLRLHSWKTMRPDGEQQTFWAILLCFSLASAAYLWRLQDYGMVESIGNGFFYVLSFASTTGLPGMPVLEWSDFEQYLFFILLFSGGSIASVAGGIKVLRFVVLLKSAAAEMRRTLHPHMIVDIKLDGGSIPVDTVRSILTFFFLYMLAFFSFSLGFALSGMTPLVSMGVAAACLSNTGMAAFLQPGTVDMTVLAGWVKGLCACAMLLGRMEVLAFLVVLWAAFQDKRSQW